MVCRGNDWLDELRAWRPRAVIWHWFVSQELYGIWAFGRLWPWIWGCWLDLPLPPVFWQSWTPVFFSAVQLILWCSYKYANSGTVFKCCNPSVSQIGEVVKTKQIFGQKIKLRFWCCRTNSNPNFKVYGSSWKRNVPERGTRSSLHNNLRFLTPLPTCLH
jgi:hypothetical protein